MRRSVCGRRTGRSQRSREAAAVAGLWVTVANPIRSITAIKMRRDQRCTVANGGERSEADRDRVGGDGSGIGWSIELSTSHESDPPR